MKWLSNIGNPEKPNAKFEISVNINQSVSQAWEQRLKWLEGKIIGKPKATPNYTVKELEDMDIVGVYVKEDGE